MSSIRSNRFFNNPEIGTAFQNIAQMFAPPSAQDTYAYAKAKSEREAAGRLSDLYANPHDPMASNRAALLGLQDYGNTPAGFATSTETLRRGQDLDSADARYGHDRTFDASTQNNVRDNARAVQTNAADNARAIENRRMQEAGQLQRFYAEPVKLAQGERAYLPNQTAEATGLPTQLDGSAKPFSSDEVVAQAMAAMPRQDVEQFARDKFAPTETQVQGQERRDLRSRGLVTDDDLVSTIMGASPLEEVVGPDGRTPMLLRRSDAVGMQPAPKSPSTVINTGAAGDGKLREKLDENEGKRWSELQGAAATASGLQQDLGLLSELIDQAPQGPVIGRLAEYFPEATTAGAAFQSVISRAAPGLRVEGSGATSDIEYDGMVRSLPRMRNDPQANRLIVGMMQAKAEVNIRRGEIVNAYQNGKVDAAQAREQLAALNRQSILSPGLRAMIEQAGGTETAATASPSVEAGTVEGGYRFKGGDPADAANWELVR